MFYFRERLIGRSCGYKYLSAWTAPSQPELFGDVNVGLPAYELTVAHEGGWNSSTN